ncbi:MAG: hypothetical protein K9L57_10250 [Spirochaetaceae bacterium]|nr:hypothetical protein [Spirochaetaceae bacterium]
MKNRIVIAMTAWRRPEYTRAVLESIAAADKPKPVYLVAHVEPDDKGVEKCFEGLPFEVEVKVNDTRLGGPKNTLSVMSRAFELSSQVIKLEDDTPIAGDALRYFLWGLKKYRRDESVFSICGYNRSESRVAAGLHSSVFRLNWFTPWGWATWKREWESILDGWPQGAHGWDAHIHKKAKGNRVEIRPYLSRVQNIGAREGYNCNNPEFHRKKQFTPEWAGNYEGLLCEEWVEE